MNKKTVLLTGGASGIGRQVAESLAKEGHRIFLNYRKNKEGASGLTKRLSEEYSIQAEAIQADVSNAAECRNMINYINEKAPAIDILIHNAGPYIKERKRMTDYTEEEWEYMINGNLNAVFYLSKAVIPQMRDQNWGRIITYGFDRVETAPGWLYRSAFASAKSGVASLTRTIALEEAQYGITANMVCPGDIIGEWKEKEISSAAASEDHDNPIGRPGTGEDISRVISFLCHDHSDFITGSIIPVTGGKDVLGKVKRP